MLTIPNIISIARLAGVPIFLWALLQEGDVVLAAWILAVIGASDWVDGVLARKLGQETELGKLLDPLADRVALAAAVVGGWAAGVLPGVLAAPLLLRELVVAVVAAWLGLRRLPKLEVRWLGKTATLLLYVSAPAFYLAAAGAEASRVLRPLGWVSGMAGLALYYLVLWQYAGDVRAGMAGRGGG